MNKVFTAIFFAVLLNNILFAQNQKLLIENVNVIPLHINQQWENKDIIIENRKIVTIRNHQESDTTQYDLGKIEGSGKFLTPAFTDAHIHLPKKENLERFFMMNLANGVTTLRSMRGETWHTQIDTDKPFTPRLLLGSNPVEEGNIITQAKADSLIQLYKKQGFDFVKILGVKDKTTFEYLVKSSQTFDFPLAGHCPRNISIFDVSKSGTYQSIEHMGGITSLRDRKSINQAIEETAQENIYHCATLDYYYTIFTPEDELRKRAGINFLPKKLLKSWKKSIKNFKAENDEKKQKEYQTMVKNIFDAHIRYLKYMYQQGALLLVSPDASGTYNIWGYGVHTEMQHYTKANISNFDILKANCYNLSEMWGTENEWGSIKVGTSSDLVLLNANPLENIENTQKIEGIVFKGKYYTQKELLNKLK